MARTIKITCAGAGFARLEELKPLQGGLKKLDEKRYRKLKKSLLDHGFSFPFFVWKAAFVKDARASKRAENSQHLYILDGHQRDRVLRRLQRQGYEIPPLPIDYIDARDEKEAREKLLVLTSQYGRMDDESLIEYLKESDLDIEDVADKIDLPGLDVERLVRSLLDDARDGSPLPTAGVEYLVVVECLDQTHQLAVLKKIEAQNLRCRAVVVDNSKATTRRGHTDDGSRQ